MNPSTLWLTIAMFGIPGALWCGIQIGRHRERQAEVKSESDPPWMVKIPTKNHLGTPVDIVVFPWPLNDGSFVVNFHTEDDLKRKDGRCFGVTIKPEPVEE